MYLSQLILNSQNRNVIYDQANPYELHRTIMLAFPAFDRETERVLFRIDGTNLNNLLVQSTLKPEWQPLIEKKGYLCQNPEIKTLEIIQFKLGQLLRFKLRANPIKRDAKTGKRVALVKDEERIAWLIRKGKDHGFGIKAEMASSHSTSWRQFTIPIENKRRRATLNIVDFYGTLQVEDGVLLNQAIRDGIGPAKGLGCGLLSLVRL